MAQYIYGCDHKEHPRVNIVHGMFEAPILECEVCGGRLHKIPTPFRWGVGAFQAQLEWNIRNYRHRLRKEPKEIMYDQVSTDRGMPGKDLHTRK